MEENGTFQETATPSEALHREDQTFGMITQNVNGFGVTAADRAAWFSSFRTSDDHGRQDVVLLHETHVGPQEVRGAEDGHALTWGFRLGPTGPRLSFWAPAHDNKAGVGILVDPYGGFTHVEPYAAAESPHFMAVKEKTCESPVQI
jgi:hypothetical protein